MRIVHTVPHISNEASGPSYSVVQLCGALREAGSEVTLVVLGPAPESVSQNNLRTFSSCSFPRRLGRSPAMRRWLDRTATSGRADVIHNHSLWMMPNVYPGWATRNTKIPLVVSPRGTLSTWALNRSKWTKRILWNSLQGPAIRHAACFHATAETEFEDIRRAGFKQPVCIIPNGVNIPALIPESQERPKKRRLLFLGRIHPKKGVDILLRAWASVEGKYHDWELQIVGPDNIGYLSQMQALAQELRLSRVVFSGPLFGEVKFRAYREADLFVLPTHSENFGMTVAEALASGTPAIVTQGAPWAALETHQAGWWIEIGVDPLVACLEHALSCSPEMLAAMGLNGRQWMQKDFSWQRIGQMMLATYQWILGGGKKPEWVRLT